MLSKLSNLIEKIFKFLSAAVLFGLFLIIFAQVILRYCFNTGFKWIDGVSVMGFIWIGMLGSAIGVHTDSLARVTLVEEEFKKHECFFFWIQRIVCLIFMFVLSYASILFTKQSGNAVYQVLKIPYSVQYVSITVFSICSIIFLLDDIVNRIKKGKEV